MRNYRPIQRRKRGRPRKIPDTAIMALIYQCDTSSYAIEKSGIMAASQIYYASRENITHLTLKFFIKLGRALHLKPTTVIERLMKLQKIYPPKQESRKELKSNKSNGK